MVRVRDWRRWALASCLWALLGLFFCVQDCLNVTRPVEWYDTGHDLNAVQVLLDRAAWLRGRVGLRPIAPALRERLRED